MATAHRGSRPVIAITGPVVDIEFPTGHLPGIFNAVDIERPGSPLVAEVQQHLGNDWVRAVAMTTTDGLARGTRAADQGVAISVPVGAQTLGRVFNVLGQAIDGKGGSVDASSATPDPPRGSRLRPAVDCDRGLRDRHQGDRPDLRRSPRAARSASSAAPAWARRSSSRSSSATSPRSTPATRFSREWASGPARATTCSTR